MVFTTPFEQCVVKVSVELSHGFTSSPLQFVTFPFSALAAQRGREG